MILFYDTETTGLVDRFKPIDHPDQPHLLQLAALLMEDDGTERGSLSAIINPGMNVQVPEAASNVHGLTTELVRRVGLPGHRVIAMFDAMAEQAERGVAHNTGLDDIVLATEYDRNDWGQTAFDSLKTFCTMLAATPICKILHANPRGPADYKWPRLEECIRHFFDEELIGAHDALVDVRACARVYFHLRDMGKVPPTL